jgi:hypothetical protein
MRGNPPSLNGAFQVIPIEVAFVIEGTLAKSVTALGGKIIISSRVVISKGADSVL